MKWEIEDVRAKVAEIEEQDAKYRLMALKWEQMWGLKAFDRTLQEAQDQGYEQIVMPMPYNVVNLTTRLVADDPKVNCPPRDLNQLEIDIAEKKERWLTAAWQNAGQQQGQNLISNAKWQSAVRGKHVFEVLWVDDVLPKRLQGRRFPILIRNLDPLNVGIRQGPLYTEYAYHRYETDPIDVYQRYPAFKNRYKEDEKYGRRSKVTVTDFWYTDANAEVWHCVVCNDEFVKKPVRPIGEGKKLLYQSIPIVVGGADVSLARDPAYRHLSILHPLQELWPAMCRLASMKLTGVRWYYDPPVIMQNEYGEELPDIQVKPGSTQRFPWGTKVDVVRIEPNVGLVDNVTAEFEKATQEATYPGVMYGQQPGSLQAGYGVSILSNAAEGRVTSLRYNLERSIERVNELMLGLVETGSGESKGVRVWGQETGSKKFYYETLLPAEIDGYHENHVALKYTLPQTDVQDQTLGLRLVESGIVSREWYRDNLISAPLPPDEQQRVLVEQMMEDAEIKKGRMLAALQRRFPDEWQNIIQGTQFDPAMQAQAGAMPPEGAAGMMPPGMPPQMPPQGMMPPGMDPSMMGGMMPPMNSGPQSLPSPMGMPPSSPPMMPPLPGGEMQVGLPMQPPSMNMDAGTFPPNTGQFAPENMGMPPNVDPTVWATLMGRPLSPAEELDALGGM